MVIQLVREKIKEKLKEIGYEADKFSVTRPDKAEFGDYSTNVALQLDTKNSKNLAEKLAAALEKDSLIEKAEEKNGFVNLFLSPQVWQEELSEILHRREDYGLLDLGQEKTVNVEFISANPTGELHVGNGRGAFFGDVLANLLEKGGYNVKREYIINDAKSSTQIQELGKTALGKGEAYLTDYLKKIIKELKPQLKEINNEGQAGFIVAQRIITDIKKFVAETLKIRIDKWFSENELFESGQIDSALKTIPTYQKEKAVWIKTNEYGDDEDRVVVRSTGQPTYFLSDIAYHTNKAQRADLVINIWGADHQGHVKRMMAVADILGFGEKLQIFISQIVHIKEGGEAKKMSKRAGELVSLKWLIDEVGLDAARFFYLSKALSTHMDFDVALAKEQSQKNPVFYVQYSYARSHQIFAKASGRTASDAVEEGSSDLSLLKEPAELKLAKKLSAYPELIEKIVTGYDTTKGYDLHKLTTYATELSAVFHKFYETNRVLVDDKSLRTARLALLRAYQIVLKDTLDLLGISAPERM